MVRAVESDPRVGVLVAEVRDYVPLRSMTLLPVKDPKPADVSDLDPEALLSSWLRWSDGVDADAPTQLRMDTVALLAALVAARGGVLRGPHDL